jgi:hypothetical protein
VATAQQKTREQFDGPKLASNTLQFLPVAADTAAESNAAAGDVAWLPQHTSHIALKQGIDAMNTQIETILRCR